MRVLITGVDGFVGSHAAELLVAQGVEVHGSILCHDQKLRNIAHLRTSLTLHQADITEAERVNALVQSVQPDRILHIAGQAFVPASLQNPMETFQVNMVGGLSVLEAARKQLQITGKSPSVLVVTSGEVYGRIAADQLPMTEQLPLSPNTPYAASKACLDLIAQQYAATFGVDVTIVRPFNHAGPRQSPTFVVSDFAKQFAAIALRKQSPVLHVGNISVRRDITDVRDVVKAYWALFQRKSDDFIFNVCSGRTVEIRALLTMLREISGLHVDIGQEPQRIRSYDIPVIAASYERLHNATGWQPDIPLRKTIEDVYAYWLEELRTSQSAAAPSP